MGEENTPPASPREALMEEEAEEELEGAVEVIDLDELVGDDDDLEDENELEELTEEIKDNSKLVFKEHSKSVFCVDVQPKQENPLVASGGEDDLCYIWKIESGEIVKKISAFKDSVTHVKFNHDGSFLAVADMSGCIMVLKILPNLAQEPVWTFETGDISWLDWHPGANVLFAGTEDSSFWMWKIPNGQSKIFQGHGEKVETAKILPDGKKAAVGYSDGTLRIFDLRTEEVVHNLSLFTDKSAICAIDTRSDNQLISAGSAEGEIAIVNCQNGKILGHLFNKKSSKSNDSEESQSNSIESLSFSVPEMNLLISADVDGNFTVWDLSSQVAKVSSVLGSGLVKLAWIQDKISVATFDGLIRIVDPRTGNPVEDYSGHSEHVLDFAVSKDLKFLVSASDDKTCRVYDLNTLGQ